MEVRVEAKDHDSHQCRVSRFVVVLPDGLDDYAPEFGLGGVWAMVEVVGGLTGFITAGAFGIIFWVVVLHKFSHWKYVVSEFEERRLVIGSAH